MENKKLDFNTPLLSVRRFHSSISSSPRPPTPETPPLPFYKSDLKSGPVRDPGVVPFTWEQTPGRPKHDSNPNPNPEEFEPKEEKSGDDDDDDDVDSFCDALDTLSRTGSCSMNCSVSGGTGIGGDSGSGGSFLCSDPQARDFMMGRFLPAAQAMASGGSPQVAPKRAATFGREPMRRIENGEKRLPLPVPYRSVANVVARRPPLQRPESDEDDDEDDERQLSVKGCGLLPKFWLKGSFCLVNPLPGVRYRGRGTRLTVKASSNCDTVAEVEHETWEAVYRHKLGHGVHLRGEDDSKLTTESYPITYWSNSQSPEGSSPYRHSNVGGISPYRNDVPQSPFCEGKGFLGFPPACDGKIEKVESFESCGKNSNYWELRPPRSSKSGSGSYGSPVVEKTLYVDHHCTPETPKSKPNSTEAKILVNSADRNSETATVNESIEEKFISEVHEPIKLQDVTPEIVGNDLPVNAVRQNPIRRIERKEHGENFCIHNSETTKLEYSGKGHQALLPPPLPKSPSESWLWRTLPSVSSKQATQSFLGIQLSSKKNSIHTTSAKPNMEEDIDKPSNVHSRQSHFPKVLADAVEEDK